MEVKAKLHYLRIAPRKVRLVAGLIKGMPVANALIQLKHLPKRSSVPVEKLLKSAIANAKHNFNLEDANLRVKSLIIDGGPVLKRSSPRAFGRAALIRKRTSHLTLTLDEMVQSTGKSRTALKKKEGPEIREVSLEELGEIEREEAKQSEKEGVQAKEQGKAKESGFVKRMFNRKAV